MNGTIKKIFHISLLAFMAGAPLLNASAEGEMASGKPQKGPCFEDRKKFCSDVEKGKGRIIDCMISKLGELSSECKTVVEKVKAGREACQADSAKLCPDMKMGEGLKKCMKEKESEVSQTCKDHINKRKENRQERGEKRKMRQKGKNKSEDEDADDELF